MLESINRVRVYHGTERDDHQLHRRMFFSTDRNFAAQYGNDIHTYDLDTTNMIDSLDGEMIADLLPLYDPYTDSEIKTLSDYWDRSSDTWEIIEDHADSLVSRYEATGLIIYEGGCRNFMVYDTSCLRRAD